MDIAKLWELCLKLEYNREVLVESLEGWIKSRPHQHILDCACGTGFPSIELLKRGYNITCTDASREMLAHFTLNAVSSGIKKQPILLRWQDLPAKFKAQFDLVMCRGSSLIYVDGWDNDVRPQEKSIYESLQCFRMCLKPGGFLYVDTTSEENLKRSGPEHSKLGPVTIDGNEILLEQTVSTNAEMNIRHWHTTISVNGTFYDFDRHSYYLSHERLIHIMLEVGFKEIRKESISGERYAVFSATV